MDMSGDRIIPAPREVVWRALNDPAVLKAAIPGCQELEMTGDQAMRAVAVVKVGPVQARFAGKVNLRDVDAPNAYRIEGEGQGGVAGFAKGGAAVRLADAEGGTKLTYDVQAQVGGKLAQLGGRMIDATAKQMADAFFARFAAEIERQQSGEGIREKAAPSSAEPTPPASIDMGALLPSSWLMGVAAGLLGLLGGLWLLRRGRTPSRRMVPVRAASGEPIVIDATLLDDLRLLQQLKRSLAER
ncbi:MAG TPA: carbon monoxide dehydrogenase subunit G [Acetobacteraceae bacterium]|nr:carbon monoxide dehydrogenase subunit G [Acetobacteraceae bacterium]